MKAVCSCSVPNSGRVRIHGTLSGWLQRSPGNIQNREHGCARTDADRDQLSAGTLRFSPVRGPGRGSRERSPIHDTHHDLRPFPFCGRSRSHAIYTCRTHCGPGTGNLLCPGRVRDGRNPMVRTRNIKQGAREHGIILRTDFYVGTRQDSTGADRGRVIIPGNQALLGFQFAVILQRGFTGLRCGFNGYI